jgi:hypothetical protein
MMKIWVQQNFASPSVRINTMSLFYFIFIMGCTPKATVPTVTVGENDMKSSPKVLLDTKKKSKGTCTKLTGILHEVGTSEDPLAAAEAKRLLVNDGDIRVLITVQEGVETYWLEDESITHELSLQNRHQLLISPAVVCDFSSDARILSVSIPNTPSSK